MKRLIFTVFGLALFCSLAQAYDLTLHEVPACVYFSPKGGAQDALVAAIGQARESIYVQAYSFTSAPIAEALIDAKKRGVRIEAVLDKS